MKNKKAWIYEIHPDPEILEKCIKLDMQHAKKKGYEVLGVSKFESSPNRRDDKNFQLITDTMLDAYDAGANIILTSGHSDFCKNLYQEVEKVRYCHDSDMVYETTVSELLEGINYLDRCLFSSRFAKTSIESIADLYDYYFDLKQKQNLSVKDDEAEPTWEQILG